MLRHKTQFEIYNSITIYKEKEGGTRGESLTSGHQRNFVKVNPCHQIQC